LKKRNFLTKFTSINLPYINASMPAAKAVAPPFAGCRTVAAGVTFIIIISCSAFLPTATIFRPADSLRSLFLAKSGLLRDNVHNF